jgi:hypothetical protein
MAEGSQKRFNTDQDMVRISLGTFDDDAALAGSPLASDLALSPLLTWIKDGFRSRWDKNSTRLSAEGEFPMLKRRFKKMPTDANAAIETAAAQDLSYPPKAE